MVAMKTTNEDKSGPKTRKRRRDSNPGNLEHYTEEAHVWNTLYKYLHHIFLLVIVKWI